LHVLHAAHSASCLRIYLSKVIQASDSPNQLPGKLILIGKESTIMLHRTSKSAHKAHRPGVIMGIRVSHDVGKLSSSSNFVSDIKVLLGSTLGQTRGNEYCWTLYTASR
jgi:hypothetical protein